MSLQTRIGPPRNERLPSKPVNPARGQKPPWYKMAARTRAERNYTPRYDLDD